MPMLSLRLFLLYAITLSFRHFAIDYLFFIDMMTFIAYAAIFAIFFIFLLSFFSLYFFAAAIIC